MLLIHLDETGIAIFLALSEDSFGRREGKYLVFLSCLLHINKSGTLYAVAYFSLLPRQKAEMAVQGVNQQTKYSIGRSG